MSNAKKNSVVNLELERIENETRIDQNKYISYLAEADTSIHQISKTRYCFVYNRKYFEKTRS